MSNQHHSRQARVNRSVISTCLAAFATTLLQFTIVLPASSASNSDLFLAPSATSEAWPTGARPENGGPRADTVSTIKTPSPFDLPSLQRFQASSRRAVAILLARGDFAAAERLLRLAIERLPYDAQSHYNLACVSARLGKKENALANLKRAVELGFRDVKHIEADADLKGVADDERFATILKQAADSTADPPSGWKFRIEPGVIADGQGMVTERNVVWVPRIGLFRVLFKADDDTTDDRPICTGYGRAGELLRQWHEEGTAAGNQGDLYDNHDSDHSNMNYRVFPQLTRIEFSNEAKKRRLHHGFQHLFLYGGATIGNSSTALTSGPMWRSQPRLALSQPRTQAMLYLQYISNHLYFYPEHRDHDPGHNGRKNEDGSGGGYGDILAVNTPYMIISQGSSGSDRAFLDAVGATLAAFRPAVKRALVQSKTLMPTVQMIFRMSNKPVKQPTDYLTGAAHPTVFEGKNINAEKMVTLAHSMTLDTLPPMVQLKVIEEDQPKLGRDYFDIAERIRLCNTPCAIGRVMKSSKYEYRMIISAERSKDLRGQPLTYHWAVLRGDADRITIRKLNESGSRVELIVPYHERRPIVPGSAMESNRVDIGAFVESGGVYSAPAFVSFFYLDNERRVYDDTNRIVSIDYTDPTAKGNYVDPAIDTPKDWRDEYHYDNDGQRTGWTRIRGDHREEFTADGLLIMENSDDESPAKTGLRQTAKVRYVARPHQGKAPVIQQQVTSENRRFSPQENECYKSNTE